MMRAFCAVMLLSGAALSMGGCGARSQAADSPEALFVAFDQAMRAGDFGAAADLVDYSQQAQAANEDVDVSAKSQQNLITQKMREATVAGLQSFGYPPSGLKAQPAQIAGDRATLAASGGGKSLDLQMAKTDAGWRIIGGVPGMLAGG